MARDTVTLGVVGIALRRGRVAAAGQLQRRVVGEAAGAAGICYLSVFADETAVI